MISAKRKVLRALESGPAKSSEIQERCGYDPVASYWDATVGIETRTSWQGSPEQKALGKLVAARDVLCRRDRCQNVWYLLHGQRLPRIEGPSIPAFPTLCRQIYELLSPKVCNIQRRKILKKDDVWHTFILAGLDVNDDFGVTLQMDSGGWSLADGDPICNWCYQTFNVVYPFDTDPAALARRIEKELRRVDKEDREWWAKHGGKK